MDRNNANNSAINSIASNPAERIQEKIQNFATPQNLKLIHLIFICLVAVLIFSLMSSEYSKVIRVFLVLSLLVFGALDSWVIFFDLPVPA